MGAKIRAWLRTPEGWTVAWMMCGGLTGMLFTLITDVPGRWVDDWPVPLRWGVYFGTGVLIGYAVHRVRIEVERWRRLRDEYAAAQRDIRRMERGER